MMIACGQEMLAQPLHIVQIILYLLFLLYGGLMCFYGFRLWRRVPPCYLPSRERMTSPMQKYYPASDLER
jgi:hypothetical protein